MPRRWRYLAPSRRSQPAERRRQRRTGGVAPVIPVLVYAAPTCRHRARETYRRQQPIMGRLHEGSGGDTGKSLRESRPTSPRWTGASEHIEVDLWTSYDELRLQRHLCPGRGPCAQMVTMPDRRLMRDAVGEVSQVARARASATGIVDDAEPSRTPCRRPCRRLRRTSRAAGGPIDHLNGTSCGLARRSASPRRSTRAQPVD